MAGATTEIPEVAAITAAGDVMVGRPTPAASRTRVSLDSDELGHGPDEH